VSSRTLKTEAVVLRSIRFSEADSVLHLYTLERGRVGAIAKGVRKTRSRFGARLEPLSHVELLLHEGRGELMAVRGAELVSSHERARADAYRLAVGHIGLEAMLRLFVESEAQPAAFHALTRFLDLLDGVEAKLPAQPAIEPLALSFQLKLLWLAGYLPHLAGCAACGEAKPLVGFSARAGGAVCQECGGEALAVSEAGFVAIRTLLERPLAGARGAGLGTAALRQCLRVIEASYEEHGGFRLRTLSASGRP
jgi:DNA repair protein RecO (recombination protein O)